MDERTTQFLNLLRGSPTFVIIEGHAAADVRIEQIPEIPTGVGICWVAGTLTTAAGTHLDAVHKVSTDDGGELAGSFVWTDGWFTTEALPVVLGIAPERVFPFDYTLSVPLQEDRYR